MARPIPEIEEEFDERLEALGFELVQVEWAGSDGRPIIRIRVDVKDPSPGEGVTVDDCVTVSRGLEPWLDDHPALPEKYVLEVSSPGVDRPLVRSRDFVRFAGHEVAVKGSEILADRATYLEGELLGLNDEGEGDSIRLRLPGGDEVVIALDEIAGAHLIHRWD